MAYILAADIGGTKTNIGIFDSEQGCRNSIVEETLLCKNYSNFNELLHDFLNEKEYPIERACFAAAGPVREGRVRLTNLPWTLDENELKDFLGILSVYVINDLVALAYSIPELTEKDTVTLHEGTPEKLGTIGIVAPGTGLGMSFLVWDGLKYIACPSESGHACFSPASEEELELLRFLLPQKKHVSFEYLCSGMGMPHIYKYLKEKVGLEEPDWLNIQVTEAKDPTPVIVQVALNKEIECNICLETVRFFIKILAVASGNLAVTAMTTGGIYLGGGMLPGLLSFLQEDVFRMRFVEKGEMSRLLENIPISVITNPKAGLIGAATFTTYI
jgi:glucokinase